MSIKTIQKRIKQVMMGTVISGATVFTVPMTGCDQVVEESSAARMFQAMFAIQGDSGLPLFARQGMQDDAKERDNKGVVVRKGVIVHKGIVRNRGIVIK